MNSAKHSSPNEPFALRSEIPVRVADEGDSIPRLESWRFPSRVLRDPPDRSVVVYLPETYFTETWRRFPVFYLHDGQNLFDGRTSYVAGRTWEAHTTADQLTRTGEMEPVILVGIANTGLHRMTEYTPTRDARMGGGGGGLYGRLIIEELMPFIEGTYRTLRGARDTGLGGSSLGGLISLFLGLQHAEVFGKLAVMSPSIWWDHRSILSFVQQVEPRPELRIWLDMGTAEGARHVRDTELLSRMLSRLGWREHVDLAFMEAEGAVHDEAAWAARFGDVLRFLFPADRRP